MKQVLAKLRAWWHWFETKADSKYTPLAVAVWSFLNPLLVPFPAESLLAPIALANRKRALYLTALASLMTTLGAGAGYLLSVYLYDALVAPFVGSGIQEGLAALAGGIGPIALFGIIFIAALTLIPDPPFIAAAGLLHVDFGLFMIAFFVGRTLRFVLVIGIVLVFGRRAWIAIERGEEYIAPMVTAFIALAALAALFLVIR